MIFVKLCKSYTLKTTKDYWKQRPKQMENHIMFMICKAILLKW